MSTGRNDPCPCGSGKKYKQCCMGKAAPQSQPTQRRQVDDPAILALVQQAGVHVGAGRLQQAEAG